MKTAIEELKGNWVLIAFVGAMIIWYANVSLRLNNVEAQAEENKTTLGVVLEMRTDLAVMKNDIGYIKDRIK